MMLGPRKLVIGITRGHHMLPGTHPAYDCNYDYKQYSLFFSFLLGKKAYMSIDANLVSNPKDR